MLDLKVFDQTTLPQYERGKAAKAATVSVSTKGKVTFNSTLIQQLKLEVGSKVGFALYAGQLYLIPHHDKGYQLRTSKMLPDGPKDLLFVHGLLTESIIQLIPEKIRKAQASISTYRIMISKEPTLLDLPGTAENPAGLSHNCYAIITSSVSYTARKS